MPNKTVPDPGVYGFMLDKKKWLCFDAMGFFWSPEFIPHYAVLVTADRSRDVEIGLRHAFPTQVRVGNVMRVAFTTHDDEVVVA